MPLATIRPAVSQAAITKVGRLFNGTLADILNELFQNARRAGATTLLVDTYPTPAGATLAIRDDGHGIDDPASVVTLGHSGWDAHLLATEDPAGMSVFSLAGRDVTITSRAAGRARGWTVRIASDQWDGSAELPLAEAEHPVGTTVAIDLPVDWLKQIDTAVAEAARFYPLPVVFDGAALPRRDWLEGAVAVTAWNGSRIGVFEGDDPSGPRLNFHGVTIRCDLPSVSQRHDRRLHARVDIGATPSIQFVLPARKEAVENAGLIELRVAAEAAIYDVVARQPDHSLGFDDWRRARALGIALPEARARLRAWRPATADHAVDHEPDEWLDAADAVLAPALEPHIAQPLARALRGHALLAHLAEHEPSYVGYRWYNALATVAEAAFHVTAPGGRSFVVGTAGEEPAFEAHVEASAIEAVVTVRDAGGETRHAAPTDLAFGYAVDVWDELDSARIAWMRTLTPSDLAAQLDAAFFMSRDDRDADSWYTQHRAFQDEARIVAMELLAGADEALKDRIARTVRDHLWFAPADRRVDIALCNGEVAVSLAIDLER